MASQVLSGTGNVSYTNNTGQNVRVVINFMSLVASMTWAGVTHDDPGAPTIGRNLAFYTHNLSVGPGYVGIIGNNMAQALTGTSLSVGYPTEIMLASGQTFSAFSAGVYNIVVIPEAG